MSLDEIQANDIELRDLITERLSRNGLINNIKAQLRAAVLLSLSQDEDNRIPVYDQKKNIQNFVNNSEGKLAMSLIRDFMQTLNLKHTLSVFEMEAGVEDLNLNNRDSIVDNYKSIINGEDQNSALIINFLKKVVSHHKDSSEKEINRGSLINNTQKNKRILPHVNDTNEKDRISYKSDESSEFSDVIDIADFSGKKNNFTRIPKFKANSQKTVTNIEKVTDTGSLQAKQSNKGSLNDISYNDSFSDKSSTPKHNDDKSDEDSIKEIDIEEIEEQSESRTVDLTMDSERSISLDYTELGKKKKF